MSPPANAAYYHAAYVAAVVIWGGYSLSLWWRGRRLAPRAAGGGPR
jgi:hypothetical protein